VSLATVNKLVNRDYVIWKWI